jgi:hypothetical protein
MTFHQNDIRHKPPPSRPLKYETRIQKHEYAASRWSGIHVRIVENLKKGVNYKAG